MLDIMVKIKGFKTRKEIEDLFKDFPEDLDIKVEERFKTEGPIVSNDFNQFLKFKTMNSHFKDTHLGTCKDSKITTIKSGTCTSCGFIGIINMNDCWSDSVTPCFWCDQHTFAPDHLNEEILKVYGDTKNEKN